MVKKRKGFLMDGPLKDVSTFFGQVVVLLVKHFVYSLKHPCETCFRAVFVPIGVILLMTFVKYTLKSEVDKYDVPVKSLDDFSPDGKIVVGMMKNPLPGFAGTVVSMSGFPGSAGLRRAGGDGGNYTRPEIPYGEVLNGSVPITDLMAEIGGLTSSGPFGADSFDSCDTDICFVGSCSNLQEIVSGIMNLTESFNNKFAGGVCFVQSYDGIEYMVFRNVTTIARNPFNSFSALPGENPDDTSRQIQYLVSLALIKAHNPNKEVKGNKIKITLKEPILTTYRTDGFEIVWGPMFLLTALFLVTFHSLYQVNEETDSKLRDGMIMMGLKETSFWCSHFILHTCILICAIVLMQIFGYICTLWVFVRVDVVAIFIMFFSIGTWFLSIWFCCSSCLRGFLYIWDYACFLPCLPLSSCTNVTVALFLLFNVLFCAIWIDEDVWNNPQPDHVQGEPKYPVGYYLEMSVILWVLHLLPGWQWGRMMWDVNCLIRDDHMGDESRSIRFKFSHLFDEKIHQEKKHWNLVNTFYVLVWNTVFFLIFSAFTWYFDNVLPRENYRPKKPLFLCDLAYWGLYRTNDYLQVDAAAMDFDKEGSVVVDLDPDIVNEYGNVMKSLKKKSKKKKKKQRKKKSKKSESNSDVSSTEEESEVEESESESENEKEEKEGKGDVVLQVVKVSKGFAKLFGSTAGNSMALSDFTVCGRIGQVLAILGHNGAGKSTLLNILTGLLNPTTGDALICDNSIGSNMNMARACSGVCPQHDVIMKELTVFQHMLLYASLKGVGLNRILSEIEYHLGKVFMLPFKWQLAHTLSGGQKRRLSLAMACIGNPRVLFLDEPTTGMDPRMRRKIWDYIIELKQDKLIVLTTHYMEEADTVGDKIAILARGRLRAIGDSLHLKKRFGSGYCIDVVMKSEEAVEEFKKGLKDRCTRGEYKLESLVGTKLSYVIPHHVTEDHKKFLEYVEQYGDGVVESQLSHTTLEEVFLRTIHGGSELMERVARRSENTNLESLAVVLVSNEEEEESEILIKIELLPKWTLFNVRRYVENGCPDFVEDFVFCEGKEKTISKTDEVTKKASSFVPSITIRSTGKKRNRGEDREELLEKIQLLEKRKKKYKKLAKMLMEKHEMGSEGGVFSSSSSSDDGEEDVEE